MLKKFKVSWCGECKGERKGFCCTDAGVAAGVMFSTEILEVISDI
jgi:hypothetical protein